MIDTISGRKIVTSHKSQVTSHRLQASGFSIKTFVHCLQFVAICFILFSRLCFAEEANKLLSLTKQIIEAKTNEELYIPFEELKNFYFTDNKYSQFVDFLKSLRQKKNTIEPFINYYIALTRYNQLKYLEEKQVWDEYFSQGNNYRDEITTFAKDAINATTPKDPLNIYSRLILWQFHKDQQDVFAENALLDLMNSVLEYSKSAKDLKLIKEVADKLLAYDEKGKSKELYRIYANKLITSDMKDEELSSIALGFYKEGNLELSETVYDGYAQRAAKALPKEKSIPLLTGIAKIFMYKDEGLNDMFYAESIFKRIEALGGKDAFNQELIYLRAFNLEKAKEFSDAKDLYVNLVLVFPETSHADEAVFKIGIINTYVLRNINSGRSYFEKLAQKEQPLSSQTISSLYQLGLLSQWESDYVAAKSYYNKLIMLAGENFPDTVTLCKERLKEIEESRPIEYNLKTFLDVSLKVEYANFDMSKVELKSHSYRAQQGEDVSIGTIAHTPESGCMQVEVQYLWSGHTGKTNPSSVEPSLNTVYISPGTKEINLVVVSPTGIIDRSIDMVDVY